MTEVWLVRHASTAWTGTRWCGRSDPPLTGAGEGDAAALAARLAPMVGPGAIILSSPVQRALATASAIADARRMAGEPAVAVDDDLQEVDFGWVDGLTFDEVEARFPQLAVLLAAGETEIDWPGGETAAASRKRARRAWATVAAMAERSTVVAVTHGGLISRILRDRRAVTGGTGLHVAPAGAIRLVPAGRSWQVGDTLAAEPAGTSSSA
jgi:probable phosphoglycerate mutase